MSISAATLAAAKKHAEQEIHKAELDDIQLDKTLKKSNYAADAKTVGDKLATVDASLGNRVRFDDYQSLDEDQKAIARSNIGASELTTNSIESYPEDNPQRDTMAASVGAVYDWVEFNNQLNQARSVGISMAREIMANSSCIKRVKMESPFILLQSVSEGWIQMGISLISETIPPCLFHGGGIAVTYNFDMMAPDADNREELFKDTIPSYYIAETLSGDEIIELRGFPESPLFEEMTFPQIGIPTLFMVQNDIDLGDITLTRGLYICDIRILGISMYDLLNVQFAPSSGTWENLNLSEDKITRTQTISETKSSFIFKEQLESPETYSSIMGDTPFKLIKISNTTPTLEQLSNFTVYSTIEPSNIWVPFEEEKETIYVSDNGGAAVLYEDFVLGELRIPAGLYFTEIYDGIKIEGILLEFSGDLEILKAENKIKHELLPDHLQFGNIPRTFGTARAIENTLFWDGNMKGLEIGDGFYDEGQYFSFVRISDYVPSLEQLSQPWEIVWCQNERKQYIKQVPATDGQDSVYTVSELVAVVLTEMDIEGQKMLPGIYFIKLQAYEAVDMFEKYCCYTSQLTIPGADLSPKPGKIDPKYLPGVQVPMVELTTVIDSPSDDLASPITPLSEAECAALDETAKTDIPIVIRMPLREQLDGKTIVTYFSAQFMFASNTQGLAQYMCMVGPTAVIIAKQVERWACMVQPMLATSTLSLLH